MCGICGFTGFKDDELLHRMTDVIKHRGPDGEGYYSSDEINLGVRRLAIIDLKTGDQPIYNEDKTIVIIFNGEIYNYLELRKQLESKGHRFYTNTDTEVIVHLYEEYKENCVQYLCGMFAFAIWDIKEKQLFLARDRLGIKPLYYSKLSGNLIFSSEIKSILECKKVSRDINLNALDQYLTFLYIPSPLTIFKEIFQLPPASYLIYKNKDLKIYKYWDLIFDKTSYSEDFYIQNLDGLLEEVIKQHLISDVPIGIFLSGGIDSSTISVYASRIIQSQLNAFTIGYLSSDKEYNELNKASLVSKKLGLNCFEYIVNPDLVLSLLPNLVKYFDQPFADSSSIVTYLISKLSSEKLTVALTGIGGDELFCGYPRYQGMKVASFLPKFYISERIINWLPESYTAENTIGRFKRFLYGLNFSTIDRYISFVSYLQSTDKLQYYTDEFRSELNIGIIPHRYFFELTQKESLLDRIMYADINTYLVDDLLCMADRMSMANSIELRVPFCDHRVVEFIASIPAYLRMKGFSLKYLLKKLLKKYLPKEIVGQKKMGFMVPLARWLRDIFNLQVEDFIRKREYSDYLNYEFIRKMWNNHITYKKNYADQLWSLLVLEGWRNIYNIELPRLKESVRSTSKSEAGKILLINIAGIGDFLESVFVIKAVRGRYKNSKIYLVVSSKVYQYAKRCPYVDGVFGVSSTKGRVEFSKVFEIFEIAKKLRSYRFDVVINLYEVFTYFGVLKMVFFLKLIGGKVNIGRDTDGKGFFYDRKVPDRTSWEHNQSYYFGKIAELLDMKVENKDVEFWHSEQEKQNVLNLLDKIGIKNNDFVVGINPGGDRKTRQWFPEKFAFVADYLIKNYSSKILIFGVEEERPLAEEIFSKMTNGKPHILCGKTNISELILLIKRCNIVVSTNSAAMHIAGLVGTPVVGLIGPGNPFRDRPTGDDDKIKLLYKKVDCNPCYHWECKRKEKICMTKILPEEVIKAVEELIKLNRNG